MRHRKVVTALFAMAILIVGFIAGWAAQEIRIEEMRKNRELLKDVGAAYQAQLKNLRGEK